MRYNTTRAAHVRTPSQIQKKKLTRVQQKKTDTHMIKLSTSAAATEYETNGKMRINMICLPSTGRRILLCLPPVICQDTEWQNSTATTESVEL